ncbi:unnamed protein product [Rotaria sp. Silwood1]|nr:unnamed protein product [Rotaria sp. Silwood1]CAF1615209.1 unnamed protein product [Rotaria sp. Silwood1]
MKCCGLFTRSVNKTKTTIDLNDRCIGCLLCHMIGDQLGAGVEGYSAAKIKSEYGTLCDDVAAPHMGVEELGPRIHMYTDDTNSMLALAHSLVTNRGLKPKHAAQSYAQFWSTGVKRGYPESAQASMQCVLDGQIDYRECGRINFPDGSFANGGAVRIAPIALSFRNASDSQLYEAVRMAIISSHVHPESIDGAFVLAKAIILALRCNSVESFDPLKYFRVLKTIARTRTMKNQIKLLIGLHTAQSKKTSANIQKTDIDVVQALGNTFQLKAIEAVPCALWIVCTGYREPEECLVRGVNMGGDTDTVAAIIGDIIGALHGWKWIPARWIFNLNKRFNNFLNDSNFLIKINILPMSKSNFESYKKNIVTPNRQRINIFRLSNQFIAENIFSSPNIILRFINLEILILENIDAKYLDKIINYLIDLPKFHSLNLSIVDYIQTLDLFVQIFRLSRLKYCKIIYQRKIIQQSSSIKRNKYSRSPIQCLIINGDFPLKILRLTTFFDEAYLNAKRWEELILSSMPNLRIFDIYHEGSIRNNDLTYHDIINQFNSSFCRKDFTFYWKSAKQICSNISEMNFNSVNHLYVYGEYATQNDINYFPNVTQLAIQHYFEALDNSIIKILNRMIPLKQLTKLVTEHFNFSFEELVKFLPSTPNLCTLKLNYLSVKNINLNLIKESKIFQYVSNTNKIKNLDFRDCDSLNQVQLIVNLFPRLESLKIGMNKKEIEQIIKFLLSKSNIKTQHLFLLCISNVARIYPKRLKVFIKSESLLQDYRVEYLNEDLYLWW